jgi:hypothetical protein
VSAKNSAATRGVSSSLSYEETLLVNYGPRSYFHHIAITCLLYSHGLLYLHSLLFSTRYAHNLCFKQTDEIDNLIASWEQSTWLCVCRFRVAASKQSLDEAPYINCPKLSQTTKHHLQSSLSAFLLDDKPWFLNWGKTCCYIHQNLLLGFTNWPIILLHQLCPSSFLAPSSPRHHRVWADFTARPFTRLSHSSPEF